MRGGEEETYVLSQMKNSRTRRKQKLNLPSFWGTWQHVPCKSSTETPWTNLTRCFLSCSWVSTSHCSTACWKRARFFCPAANNPCVCHCVLHTFQNLWFIICSVYWMMFITVPAVVRVELSLHLVARPHHYAATEQLALLGMDSWHVAWTETWGPDGM